MIAGKDGVNRGFRDTRVCAGFFGGGGEGNDGERDGGDRGICDLAEEIAWTASPEFDEIREKRAAESEKSRTYPTLGSNSQYSVSAYSATPCKRREPLVHRPQ